MNIDFSKIVIEKNIPVPPRAHGGRVGAASVLVETLKAMPVDGSFLIPVTIPNNIKKEEREAFGKEQAKRITNTVAGATRRISKKDGAYVFTVRSVDGGVRVWRLPAETAAPAPAETAEAA